MNLYSQGVKLARHPRAAVDLAWDIGVSVDRAGKELALRYTIAGDITRLRVPPGRPPRMKPELWQHTCCECFVAVEDQAEYYEFNLAPSREWAAYAFAKYREGGPLADETLDPGIVVRRFSDRLELDASISLDRLTPAYANAALVLGLSAVIEDTAGRMSYWALTHPADKPDFHHPGGFALRIPSIS